MNIIKTNLQFKGKLIMNNTHEYIIVHHALAKKCTICDIHKWHLNNGWAGCGYHYFVSKDGQVYEGRPVAAVGAHCTEQNMNSRSIGVCLEGCYEDYTNQTNKDVPEAQLNALIELTKYLMGVYKITIDKVKKHCDYATYKKCPGNYFIWDKFVEGVINVDQVQEVKPVEWQRENFDKLVKSGKIQNPDVWLSKWEQDIKVKDIMGLLGKLFG